RYATAQRHRREAIAFEGARNGGRAALDEFLRAHPEGVFAKEARRMMRQLAEEDDFALAESHDTPASWSLYVTTHPAGKHADAAWENGTAAAWDRYLSAHGDSKRADDARQHRREANDFEQAAGVNTKTMWRAFVNAWPNGRHRLDAEVRMRAAK